MLMGFGKDHTVPAVPSAQLSSNKRGSEYIRKALVGNSFCCQVIAWQLGHCLFAEGLLRRRPSLEEPASGRCLELVVPLEKVVHGQPEEMAPESSQERSQAEPGKGLTRRLANLSYHRSSDVSGTLETSLRPIGWPRGETPAPSWRWKVAFAMPWQLDTEHFNILELRAALATLSVAHATTALPKYARHPPLGLSSGHRRLDKEEIVERPLETSSCPSQCH